MSDLREVLQENSYLRQKQLIFADCDRYQRARVSTLLSIAAAVAGADYDARGLTYEKLYEMREVFLLSRIALRIHRCPRALQVVDVTTWEDGVKAAHMQRVYEITDREGLLVSIRSDWILVDPQTRRIMRPGTFTARKLGTCPKTIDAPQTQKILLPHEGLEELGTRKGVWSDLDCPEPKKVMLPKEGLEDLGNRVIRWSDLDGNGHVYSGNYGDFVWDYLPADLQEQLPKEFFINYSKEATLGQELRMVGVRRENEYLMEGLGPEGVCFSARCVF